MTLLPLKSYKIVAEVSALSILTYRLIFCAGRVSECEIMAKDKNVRGIIKLQSTESSHCYFTEKNKNNSKERIQLRKYDPTLRKHVMYKEAGKL